MVPETSRPCPGPTAADSRCCLEYDVAYVSETGALSLPAAATATRFGRAARATAAAGLLLQGTAIPRMRQRQPDGAWLATAGRISGRRSGPTRSTLSASS